jgi:LPXTG-motif cell wall-anchored protein
MPFQKETKEMKTRNYINAAALLTLGIAMLALPTARSQPLDDRVIVDMPYTTTIGHKTLPPGEYVIQRMPSASGSRVLLIYSDKGMKFETSAMTIPVVDVNTARDTKVVLSKIGEDHYYDKVWVQGKSYGYQFILPKEARQRQRELLAVTVPASGGSTSTTTTASNTTTVAEQAVAEPEPVIQSEVETKAEVQTPVEVAQAAPPVAEPEPAPLPESADRAADEPAPAPAPAREELPKTSSAWLAMVLGGGSLLGAGMMLRRKA